MIIDLVLQTDLSRHFEFLGTLRTCASLYGHAAHQQRVCLSEHRSTCASFRRSTAPSDQRSSIRRGSVDADATGVVFRGSILMAAAGRRGSRASPDEVRRGSLPGSIKRSSSLVVPSSGVEADVDAAASQGETAFVSAGIVVDGQPAITQDSITWISPLLDPAKVCGQRICSLKIYIAFAQTVNINATRYSPYSV